MTKITAVAPGGDCPLWRRFLTEITGGNKDLEDFLQRIAGYTLTGSTREHALFFLYGTGITGKESWGVGADLWKDFQRWSEANKEPPGTRKAFAEAMAAHGYAKDKRRGVRGYAGIDLRGAADRP
jgi:phage/plasmid-associated DNA primase